MHFVNEKFMFSFKLPTSKFLDDPIDNKLALIQV